MRLFRYSKNYYTIFSINKVDKRVTHIDSHRLTSTHTTSSQGNQGVRGVEKLKKSHFWGIFAPFLPFFSFFKQILGEIFQIPQYSPSEKIYKCKK